MKLEKHTLSKLLASATLAVVTIATSQVGLGASFGVASNGGTGCVSTVTASQAKDCSFVSPNWGITWRATWNCNYDSNGALTGADSYHRGWFVTGAGYCCNDIDTTNRCPSLSCPTTWTPHTDG